jgi:predicted GIY-YIG superfamily endonuclease
MSMHQHVPTTVYILYDGSLNCLYVGMGDWPRRLAAHEAKSWGWQIEHVTLEHYATRPRAAARERELIEQMAPRYNVRHNVTPFIPVVENVAELRELEHGWGDALAHLGQHGVDV